MMKLLAVAVILLASASISFGQAAGGGVPGPSSGGPPTGAASNGLIGTYPGPGLSPSAVAAATAGQNLTPKSIGGVYFYADQFSGTTVAQKMNACNAAVLALGGGTCDDSTLVTDTGISQVIDVPVIWGDNSGSTTVNIHHILPPVAFWTVTITTGSSVCAITQWSGSSVDGLGGPGAGGSKTMVFQTQASTNIKALYCTNKTAGWNDYIRTGDFALRAVTSGATMVEAADIEDIVDNSWFHDLFIDNTFGNALYTDHVCCGTTFERISANSAATANGGLPLQFGATSGGIMQSVTVKDSVFNSPGTGKHDMQVYSTWGTQFINVYMEGNGNAATPDTTTSMAYIDSSVTGLTWTGGAINSLCASPCASKYGIENHSTGSIIIAGISQDNDSYLSDVPNSKTYGNYGINSNPPPFFAGSITSTSASPIYNGLNVVGNAFVGDSLTAGFNLVGDNNVYVGSSTGSNTLYFWDFINANYGENFQAQSGNIFANPASGGFFQAPILNVTGDSTLHSIGATTPGTGAFTTLAVGGSQAFTSVQGTSGTKLPAASGTFTNGNLRSTNSTGDEVDSGVTASTVSRVSSAITSATAGSGISAVTCTTTACTNLRGTYTMTATTVSAGATILTLVWPTTTTAYVCLVSQDGGTLAIAPSHSVATATGMAIVSDLAVTSGSIGIDYSCQP